MDKEKKARPMSPFLGFLSEALSPENLLTLCVDRNDEVKECVAALCDRRNHLFIYGERGIGKTFLVHLISQGIRESRPGVFPCYINLLQDTMRVHPDSTQSGFPCAILRRLCTSLWHDLLGLSMSDLRAAIHETPGTLAIRDGLKRKILEVYRLVRLEDERLHYNRTSGIGAALGIKAEMQEGRSEEWRTSPWLSVELLDLIDELLEDVARPREIDQFVMLCDEANLMPFSEQKDLLLRYVELFAAKNTQFAMVMRPEVVSQAQAVFSACERIELKGFSKREHVAELLRKHLRNTGVDPTDDGIDVLWEVFSGHPLYTIAAAKFAYDEAAKRGTTFLDASLMAIAAARLLRQYREMDNKQF